jgi:hypothetical protein
MQARDEEGLGKGAGDSDLPAPGRGHLVIRPIGSRALYLEALRARCRATLSGALESRLEISLSRFNLMTQSQKQLAAIADSGAGLCSFWILFVWFRNTRS